MALGQAVLINGGFILISGDMIFTDLKFLVCLVYLIVINIIAFILYGVDKRKAKKGKWRISENTLLLIAILGGSIGAIFGMKIFHHKTKKSSFSVGLPIVLIIQILTITLFVFLRYLNLI